MGGLFSKPKTPSIKNELSIPEPPPPPEESAEEIGPVDGLLTDQIQARRLGIQQLGKLGLQIPTIPFD